jgi:hypothetical protein
MPKPDISVTVTEIRPVTKVVTKKRRGRPPIGRKALTAAQKQARYRQRLKEAAKQRAEELLRGQRRLHQPPYGYAKAKQKLIEAGHQFNRVNDGQGREFGGTFVDGAYVTTHEVIVLADMTLTERKQRLDEARRTHKDVACDAVEEYMEALRVSFDELAAHVARRAEQARELIRIYAARSRKKA